MKSKLEYFYVIMYFDLFFFPPFYSLKIASVLELALGSWRWGRRDGGRGGGEEKGRWEEDLRELDSRDGERRLFW